METFMVTTLAEAGTQYMAYVYVGNEKLGKWLFFFFLPWLDGWLPVYLGSALTFPFADLVFVTWKIHLYLGFLV